MTSTVWCADYILPYGRENECMQGFDGKARRKETTKKT
jgi:hypothetical protein